jgi:hypothetical protein
MIAPDYRKEFQKLNLNIEALQKQESKLISKNSRHDYILHLKKCRNAKTAKLF